MTRSLKNMSQTFLLLGASVLVIFVIKFSTISDFNNLRLPINPPKPKPVVYHENKTHSNVLLNNYTAKCEPNASVRNISGFDSLPEHMKEFLYYQHCRDFSQILNPYDKCGESDHSKEVFLLLVIKSSPGNYERRAVLRKTWAEERMHNGVWIRRIFISGTSGEGFEKEKFNKLLEIEQLEYGDILQWDFHDSFYNLTLKQMLFLTWMEKNCPNARFLFNGDDDVFAHTNNIVDYLQSIDNDGSKHLFTGFLFPKEKVVRWPPSKYYIPTQIQKEDFYLPYCGGGGYILSSYTAMEIHRTSQKIPLHPIDDAYMGMCLAEAGLPPSSHIGVKTLGLNLNAKIQDDLEPCYLRQLLLVHRYLPAEMFAMWKRVNDRSLKCFSSVILN